jgi:chemotaxis protein CheX
VKSALNHETHLTVRFDPNWKSILECASTEVFEIMAGTRLTINPDGSAEPSGAETAMVGLAGALCGMMTIRCTSAVASRLASQMLGGDAASNPSLITDAMGELCNMVAGNFKAKIASLSDHCMLSIPIVISGENYRTHTFEPHEGMQISLVYEDSLIWVSLFIQT